MTRLALVCLLLNATAVSAQIGETVETAFLGHLDWERSSTYSWQTGTPAMDPGFERLLHDEIDKRLAAKGWILTAGEGDFYVRSDVVRTLSRMIVALRVDVLDPGSEELAWRGMATGVRANHRKQNERAIVRVVKKMFKGFPKAPR